MRNYRTVSLRFLDEKEVFDVSFSTEDGRKTEWFQEKEEAVEFVEENVPDFLLNGLEEV